MSPYVRRFHERNMFRNEFQGGHYVEVFSAQGKDPLSGWKVNNHAAVKKVFEKDVRGFIFLLEGGPASTKIEIPKDIRQALSLVQRYLVFQLCIPKTADVSIYLGVQDGKGTKRRLFFSTTHKETQTNPLHSKIPLGLIHRCKWLNLCVDLSAFVQETWKGQTFKSLDSISISANVRLRRIFTMKAQPADTTNDEELYGFSGTNDVDLQEIPRQLQLTPDIPHETQVLNPRKVSLYEGRSSTGTERVISTSHSNHQQPDSLHGEQGDGINPHPPHRPSSDKMRRRPRVKSGGKDRTPQTNIVPDVPSSPSLECDGEDWTEQSTQPLHQTDQLYDPVDGREVKNTIYTFSSPPKSARHGQHPDKAKPKRNSRRKISHGGRKAVEISSSSDEQEEASSHGRRIVTRRPAHLVGRGNNEVSSSEEDVPHNPTHIITSITRKSLREIPRDDLRISQTRKAYNHTRYQMGEGIEPYNHTRYQMAELSDSLEKEMLLTLKRQQDLDLELSAECSPPPASFTPHHPHLSSSSGSTSPEEVSPLTLHNRRVGPGHNYQQEMQEASAKMTSEFLSQSNPRDWGKVFSPPINLPCKSNIIPNNHHQECVDVVRPSQEEQAEETDEEEELDLLFDPVLNCYFDPQSCKYYELV